jgi:hypothetical protein
VLFGDPGCVSGLMKFPQRPKSWMDAFLAFEHLRHGGDLRTAAIKALKKRVPSTALLLFREVLGPVR